MFECHHAVIAKTSQYKEIKMAKSNQNGVVGSVAGAEDGFLFIRGMEDNSLQRYLDTYDGRIQGYKSTAGDMFTNVTMKISFPNCMNENNANLWAFFIAKAAHPTCAKPRIKVVPQEAGLAAYVTWPIWNTCKYMESKNKNGSNTDF
jgi:hypothetical protein